MSNFLISMWYLAVLLSLWGYFGFVYFDLAELKPASVLRKGWGVALAFLVPLYALSLGEENSTRVVLAGIGLTAILTPVIIPEVDPIDAHSIREWVYLRTVGQWFADLFTSAVIYALAVVCSLFGSFWLYAYAAVATLFAVSRLAWIRVQNGKLPRIATASVFMLPLMLAFVFTWVGFIFDGINAGVHGRGLTPTRWQTDMSELYKPGLEASFFGWLLLRWPWLNRLRSTKLNK